MKKFYCILLATVTVDYYCYTNVAHLFDVDTLEHLPSYSSLSDPDGALLIELHASSNTSLLSVITKLFQPFPDLLITGLSMVEREEQCPSEAKDGGGMYGGAGRVEAALLCVSTVTLSVIRDALLRYSLLREYL